jgi:hypothetical protein
MNPMRHTTSIPTWMRAPSVWLWLMIAAGTVLRLRQYLFNRSFWHDETLLATAFADHSLYKLVFGVLDNNQAAPTAYLVVVKLITLAMGTNEWTLRLPSLLFGAAALSAIGGMPRGLPSLGRCVSGSHTR